MDNKWLPLSVCTINKPSAHPPGSLLAFPYESQKVDKFCWALRFDASDGSQDIPHVYFVDGSPWNQPMKTVLQCRDMRLDDSHVPGLAPPAARISIEADIGTWVRGHEIGYYEAGPYVAIGEFGYRLCGHNHVRPESAHHWINCETWQSDPASLRQAMNSSDAVTAYAKHWRVSIVIPDAKKEF